MLRREQEVLQQPTPASIAQEAEMEAQLFAQSASIDKLLNMMRSLDTQKENLAENEELLVRRFLFRRGGNGTDGAVRAGTVSTEHGVAAEGRQAH